MAKEKFIYFDDAEVSRNVAKTIYKVKLIEEEVTTCVGEQLVQELVKKTCEDENLLAILVARIDFVRKNRTHNVGRKLEDEVIIAGIEVLLRTISIDDLIAKVKSIKWHQIVNIMTADSPAQEIEEIL